MHIRESTTLSTRLQREARTWHGREGFQKQEYSDRTVQTFGDVAPRYRRFLPPPSGPALPCLSATEALILLSLVLALPLFTHSQLVLVTESTSSNPL